MHRIIRTVGASFQVAERPADVTAPKTSNSNAGAEARQLYIVCERSTMAASQLYQLLIDYPTRNVKRLQRDRLTRWAGRMNVQMDPRQVGMLPETRLMPFDLRQMGQQFQLDAAMWYGAISTGPCSTLLRKIFHLFYHAGVIYKTRDGWGDWSLNHFVNVASLLSHGQRVLVQIPSVKNGGDAIWHWLSQPNPISSRGYATHGQSTLWRTPVIFRGHHQYVEEKSGWGQSLSGHILGRHYAENVALGGLGNRNPFSPLNDDTVPSFKPILADGLNGHVYINYMPPDKSSVGGLLIGCENAQHGAGTNPHTLAGHGLGGAQKTSACGGKKWSATKLGPRQEYSGMICDLVDIWRQVGAILSANLFDPDLLDAPTRPVPAAT